MSERMNVRKLGDLGKILMCKRVLKHETSEKGDIPFYKIGTFGDAPDVFIPKELYEKYMAKYPHPRKGDILISAAGTIGKTVVYDGAPAYFQDSNIVWLSHDESQVLNSYLRYFYLTEPWKPTDGSTIKRLYNDNLRELTLTVPDIEYQKRVASVLSALDAKIALNTRINAELESLAKLVYDYWFVQFDFPFDFAQGKPLSAAQAKRMGKPALAGKPYKSSGGAMVYNAELKREVPEGWEVTELRKYIKSNRGLSYTSADIGTEGRPMINLNSFTPKGTYKVDGLKLYSGPVNASKVLQPYDLVMCNTQQTALDPAKDIIGKSMLVPDIFDKEVLSSHHVTTISVSKEYLKYYLNSLFSTEYFHRYISGYCSGTNILGLNFDGVLDYRTAIPEDGLLERFGSFILSIEQRKNVMLKENQELASLRDWLLPLLMNGQVVVRSDDQTIGRSGNEGLAMAAEGQVPYGKKGK